MIKFHILIIISVSLTQVLVLMHTHSLILLALAITFLSSSMFLFLLQISIFPGKSRFTTSVSSTYILHNLFIYSEWYTHYLASNQALSLTQYFIFLLYISLTNMQQ